MTAALSLMKNVLTPLTKSVLLPFGLSAAMSTTNAAIQKNKNKNKNKMKIRNYDTNNFKRRNRRYNENWLIVWKIRIASKRNQWNN